MVVKTATSPLLSEPSARRLREDGLLVLLFERYQGTHLCPGRRGLTRRTGHRRIGNRAAHPAHPAHRAHRARSHPTAHTATFLRPPTSAQNPLAEDVVHCDAEAYPTDALIEPGHIDAAAVLGPSIMKCFCKMEVAEDCYEYWGGDGWRNGLDKSPITDASVIASETQHKQAAEVDDKATSGTPDHATKLRDYGVRVDFLLALTFALDMWDWKTWEVVQFLVKPVTEGHRRCRFAELSAVRPFTGAATVYMSHCWNGRWGDLVAAACVAADPRRVVW